MLKKISLYAALVALATVLLPLAGGKAELFGAECGASHCTPRDRTQETWSLRLWSVRETGVTRDTVNGFESRRACNDYGARYKQIEHRWQVEYLCEAAFIQNRRRPTQAFLTEIITWLSANFDLPAIHDHPLIEFASPLKLASIRYKGKLPEGWREDRIPDPSVLAAVHREVVAVYNDATRTIYLPENWTGETATEQSVLVHEMVHHLQNLARLKFECPAAREKMAYMAQSDWLKREGLDIETEFDVDMLTVIAVSACMH